MICRKLPQNHRNVTNCIFMHNVGSPTSVRHANLKLEIVSTAFRMRWSDPVLTHSPNPILHRESIRIILMHFPHLPNSTTRANSDSSRGRLRSNDASALIPGNTSHHRDLAALRLDHPLRIISHFVTRTTWVTPFRRRLPHRAHQLDRNHTRSPSAPQTPARRGASPY